MSLAQINTNKLRALIKKILISLIQLLLFMQMYTTPSKATAQNRTQHPIIHSNVTPTSSIYIHRRSINIAFSLKYCFEYSALEAGASVNRSIANHGILSHLLTAEFSLVHCKWCKEGQETLLTHSKSRHSRSNDMIELTVWAILKHSY